MMRNVRRTHSVATRCFASLSRQQIKEYADHGALLLPSFISQRRAERLSAIVDEWIEHSRHIDAAAVDKHRSANAGGTTSSTSAPAVLEEHLILGKGHCAATPSVTRVTSPVDLHSEMWELCTGPVADIAEALLGPNVRYHHSKLNLKMAGAAETGVRWHQDIQFWSVIRPCTTKHTIAATAHLSLFSHHRLIPPSLALLFILCITSHRPHSNYSLLTVGVLLEGADAQSGAMEVVPLSAYDELHPLEDEATGEWTGVLGPRAMATVGDEALAQRVRMEGGPGTVSVHSARCVHGGPPNTHSDRHRPLLLFTFAAAHAKPLIAGTNLLHQRSRRGMSMVRGQESSVAIFDSRPCPMAPTFDTVYRPPFFAEQTSNNADLQ